MNEQDRQIEREIEANEAWLSGFNTPAPSAEALSRAKQSVHRELARQHGTATIRSWKAWHGALGAAAALALCVTVGWYAMSRQTPPTPLMVADADVQPLWPETTQQDTTIAMAMDDDISDLEEWSSDEGWSTGGADLFYTLEDAISEDTTNHSDRRSPAQNGRSQG